MRKDVHAALLVLAGLSLASGAGCAGGGSSDADQVPFRLPAGWEVKNEDGAIKARLLQPQEESMLGETLLTLRIAGTSGADSPEALRQSYVAAQNLTDPNAVISETTVTIAGIAVYLAEHQTDTYYGTPWWSTRCHFAKNGRAFVVDLNDRARNHETALTKLVETLDTAASARIYDRATR